MKLFPGYYSSMGVDIHISKIPRDLQHQVREVAIPDDKQENDESDDSDEDNEPTDDTGTPVSRKSESVNELEKAPTSSSARCGSRSTVTADDLKEQIRDVLKELLEELRMPKPPTDVTT